MPAFSTRIELHFHAFVRCVAGGPEDISREERQRAKGVVYSVVYGRGAAGLAQQLGVGQPDAQRLITSFLQTFPQVLRRSSLLGFYFPLVGFT